ncbi:hypothetical protein [Candidatus Poriferisodalis sp.]|uniref:hypothetical protein n=1 Tax=Candidatus Poriferisodalis sp. TaxID=3101277 RepID=UPI003B5240B2
MSSESRTVRPFGPNRRLRRLFNDATLRFGSQHCAADSSITISDAFERCEAWLRWAGDGQHREFVQSIREGVNDVGLRLEDCCVIAVARNGYLKMREVVFKHSLVDPSALVADARLDLAEDAAQRRRVFRGGSHGITIDAYVVLARTVPESDRRPLRPWRAGTWLAHGRFTVRCRNDTELFRPHLLDKEQRARLGLPDGSMMFADFDGDVDDPEVPAADAVTFWVDEELLQAIDAQRRSPASELIQRWLFAEFITAVIHRYANEAAASPNAGRPTYDEIKGSLIARIVTMLAGRSGADDERDDLLRDIRHRPELVIARVQDRISLLGPARKTVKEASP